MSPDEALASEVVDICSEVLGASVLGAYLHGSSVLVGLRPTSDLDVLVVIDRPTTDGERRSIVDRLQEISGRRATRGRARPVELTIVRQSELRPRRAAPVVDLLYGEWLRDAFSSGPIPEPAEMADLAPEIVQVLAGNRALAGPPPADLIDPVPVDELRRSMVAGVPSLLADLDSDTRNVLLTLARIVATLDTGQIVTKDHAGRLAASRLPPGPSRDVLLEAREMYRQGLNDDDAGASWAASLPAARDAAIGLVREIWSLMAESPASRGVPDAHD